MKLIKISSAGSVTNKVTVLRAVEILIFALTLGLVCVAQVERATITGAITDRTMGDLPSYLRAYRDAFAFGVVILVLLIRPAGLLPARTTIERV